MYDCFFFFLFYFKLRLEQLSEKLKTSLFFKLRRKCDCYKKKIREEISSANKRDRYLDVQDAQLIKEFFNKIKSELK